MEDRLRTIKHALSYNKYVVLKFSDKPDWLIRRSYAGEIEGILVEDRAKGVWDDIAWQVSVEDIEEAIDFEVL